MRYTLRLLTIQQFQRATALICACETLRRDDRGTWGEVPFRIGLWVGSRATPNRTDDAEEWCKQQRRQTGSFRVLTMTDPFPEIAHVESPAGSIYIETADSDHMAARYDRLWNEALGEAESAQLISAITEELQQP